VVIPAFNEQRRIATAIRDVIDNMPLSVGDAWELIVVNDGSSDATSSVVRSFEGHVPALRLLEHRVNSGKGAAVRTGVLAAAGRVVLFADADGATPFSAATELLQAIDDGADIAIGTRSHSHEVQRSFVRLVMGAAFRLAVRNLVRVHVSDTQCGFKMFKRNAARLLFGSSCEDGYLFEVEILGLAIRRGFTIQEVPVCWREVAGSRIRLVRDSWKMLTGLLRVGRNIRGASASSDLAEITSSASHRLRNANHNVAGDADRAVPPLRSGA